MLKFTFLKVYHYVLLLYNLKTYYLIYDIILIYELFYYIGDDSMSHEMIGTYSIYNGNVINNDTKAIYIDTSSEIVYEVIRVIDGVPLFLEEHIARLLRSSEMINIDISYLADKIASDIKKLIVINNKPDKNIKIQVYTDKENNLNYSIFFIKSSYPDAELYKKGISTILYKAKRENPNAKVQNSQLREEINKELQKSNAYEALLVNEQDYITEGSKSNVFFVKDGVLYTSEKKDVLLGVTRSRIVELAKSLDISIIEKPIHKSFLYECDGLFITGTSPKVLPISKVDEILYDSPNNEVIISLMKAYDSLIENYIASNK